MKKICLLLIFILGNITAASAQHATINPDKITLGERIFEYEQIIGDSSRTFGTIYERIEHEPKKEAFTITIIQELPNATLTDSILINDQTFLPISYRSLVPKFQDISISYSIPGNTIVDIKRNIPNRHVDTTMTINTEKPLYDYHWPHLLLYTLQPLENEDDVINLPVFTYRNQKEMQSISYVGTEAVELYGNTYEALIWEATDESTGTRQMYWIEADTNRLIQNKAEMKNGATFWFRQKRESSN